MTFPHFKPLPRPSRSFAFWFALCLLFLPVFDSKASAQSASLGAPAKQEVIGRVSGDDVSVAGAVSFENVNGRTTALLASGSDITLRSGQAIVDLMGVGDVILCGPARLSIVKSGPAITVALNYGQVHLQIGAAAQITIYTPLLIVTPQAIGDRDPDLTVGLDENGDLCITAVSGAMRIQEQFTAESLIVPQGGDMQIARGELRTLQSGSHKCSCELLVSRSNTQVQPLGTARQPANPPGAPRAADPSNQPIYRIDVPLTFNASSAPPPRGPSPQAVLIIRESVADPASSFRGVVRPALPPPPAGVSRSASESHNSKLHFLARLFSLFRHRKAPAEAQSAAAHP